MHLLLHSHTHTHTQKEILHVLVYSVSVCHSPLWARLKLRTQSSARVPPRDGRNQSTQSVPAGKLRLGVQLGFEPRHRCEIQASQRFC